MAEGKKSCFIIGPIDKPGTEIHIWAKKALKHIIKPATEACGYEAVRADEIPQPGMITRQVIERLMEDDLVVADLSWHNPNVFYELAIRHAVRKPVVQIIRELDPLPFDVLNSRTIKYDLKDPDSWVPARDLLIEHIRSAEENPSFADNPLTQAIDISLMSKSSNPAEKRMLELIEMVRGLRSTVEKTDSALSRHIELSHSGGAGGGLLGATSGTLYGTKGQTVLNSIPGFRPGHLSQLADSTLLGSSRAADETDQE